MALNADAVIVPGEGHFYVADEGSTAPTGTGVPSSPFVEVGYTSKDDPLTLTRDGGDSTPLFAWQSGSPLRTSTESVTYKLTFNLLQTDADNLALYYGGGAVNPTTDEFEVPKTPAPQRKYLFVRVVDGANVWAKNIGKVDIIGSDDIEYDSEDLLKMPVTATILDDDALSYLFGIRGATTVLP
jgi:hypothetical protein